MKTNNDRSMPRYPVYVISKGRYDSCLTANILVKDNVPFRLVVEPQEYDEYASRYGEHRVCELPFSNLGQGSIPARQWVRQHSTERGDARHWIIDDNIREFRRLYEGKRLPCHSGVALRVAEDFTDRYTNVGLSGLNYTMFVIHNVPPFFLNVHVYSCVLVNNSIPYDWRGRYNEDTDLSLQVLSGGWCTILFNAFMIKKMATMQMKGGNTDDLYRGDGRLKMARALERKWPGVVKTTRKFRRPQHHVAYSWQRFDTPLKRREDIDWESLAKNDEYGMRLKVQASEPQGEDIKKMLQKQGKNRDNG